MATAGLCSAIWYLWRLYSLVLLIRVIAGWLDTPLERTAIGRVILLVTEPALAPIRRLVPPERTYDIDFSPLLLGIIGEVLFRLLCFYSRRSRRLRCVRDTWSGCWPSP